MRLRRTALALLILSLAQAAAAQKAPPAATTTEAYDRAWRRATNIYVNDRNPAVEKVLFTGRFQYDFDRLDAHEGHRSESNIRRMRIGAKVTFLRTWTLHVETDLNPQEHDPLYQRLTDAYVQWSHTPKAVVMVGKQGVAFTLDGATSSKELLTIDRSNLSNNIWFPQEYIPGASLSGKAGQWVYRGGVYSAGTGNREFGRFDGSAFLLASGGYDFRKALHAREALLSVNYVHQPANRHNTFTRQLGEIVSTNLKFERKAWGLRADVAGASGYLGQGGLRSVMVMPFYNLTPRLQAVTRYTFISSPVSNGVRLATYESRLTSGRGDRYNEVYLGGNYYVYGHKLKLQAGLQWSDLRDHTGSAEIYDGLSFTSGLRLGW